jgi:hypothetical protein
MSLRSDPKNEEITLDQRQIDELTSTAKQGKAILAELLMSLLKWLMTSLLAINGAAAIAVLGYSGLDRNTFFWSEVFFLFGILSSLMSVLFAIFYFLKFLPDVGGLVQLKPGSHSVEKVNKLASGDEAQPVWKDPVLWVSFLPLIFFVAGFALVAAAEPVPSTSKQQASPTDAHPPASPPFLSAPECLG